MLRILLYLKLKEVALVINRVNYETQFDCKLETKDDKVIVKKDKKMSERKKKFVFKFIYFDY